MAERARCTQYIPVLRPPGSSAAQIGCPADLSNPLSCENGGSGEIRTHGRVAPSPVFKTGTLNHSVTLPY
jgi:hypothetical protein